MPNPKGNGYIIVPRKEIIMLENIKIMVNEVEVEAVKVDGIVLVNMTPHEVSYYKDNEKAFSVPVSGLPAIRLPEQNCGTYALGGMCFTRKEYTKAQNLPNKQEGVLYIVSKMVLDAVQREDFVAPDTGSGCVRDGVKIMGTPYWVVA